MGEGALSQQPYDYEDASREDREEARESVSHWDTLLWSPLLSAAPLLTVANAGGMLAPGMVFLTSSLPLHGNRLALTASSPIPGHRREK